jgi:hypothetical protein
MAYQIYIDTPRYYGKSRQRWSHMISDNLEYLHVFAEGLGIPKSRFENKKGKYRPHYDIRGHEEFEIAILKGAKLVSSKEILQILKENYKPENEI